MSSHWRDYMYGEPEEQGRIKVTREELIMWTRHRVSDAIELGEFIYTELIANSPVPFNGHPSWFDQAFDEGWIPRPRRGRWPKAFVVQSLIIVNGHTGERFDEWLATKPTTKGITFQSYVKWLAHLCNLAPTLAQTDRVRGAGLIRSRKSSVR